MKRSLEKLTSSSSRDAYPDLTALENNTIPSLLPTTREASAGHTPTNLRLNAYPLPSSSSQPLTQPLMAEERSPRDYQKESLLHPNERPPNRPPDRPPERRWPRWTLPFKRWPRVREILRIPARTSGRFRAWINRKTERSLCYSARGRLALDRQIVAVRVKTIDGKSFVTTNALVDTGSDFSYLSPGFARDKLGIQDDNLDPISDESALNLDGTPNSIRFKGVVRSVVKWAGEFEGASPKIHGDMFHVAENPIDSNLGMMNNVDIQIVLGHHTGFKVLRFCPIGVIFNGGVARAKMPEKITGTRREELERHRDSQKAKDAEYTIQNQGRILEAVTNASHQQGQTQPQHQEERQQQQQQQQQPQASQHQQP